jgi:hypothetical protein
VTVLLANIIFHAFGAPYVAPWFCPPLFLLVLGIEWAVVACWNRTAVGAAGGCVVGMNVASYLAGFRLSGWLVVGHGLVVQNSDDSGYGALSLGPEWAPLARLAFLQAWAASVVIETAVLLGVRRWTGVRRVVVPVLVANALSYAVLFAWFCFLFGRMGATPAGD